jgi:hypothetical protein
MDPRTVRAWKISTGRKWQVAWAIGLVGLLVGSLGANPAKAGSSELVVGVEQWPLYQDDTLRKEKANLPGGTQVAVVGTPGDRIEVEVRAASGASGFIHRFALCTPAEFQRRKAEGEIPRSIAKFVHENGRFYVTPITGYVDISIGHDRPQAQAGQAYWMDDSTQGKPYYIVSKQVYANHLYLVKADGSLAELPIGFGPAHGASGGDKVAQDSIALILTFILAALFIIGAGIVLVVWRRRRQTSLSRTYALARLGLGTVHKTQGSKPARSDITAAIPVGATRQRRAPQEATPMNQAASLEPKEYDKCDGCLPADTGPCVPSIQVGGNTLPESQTRRNNILAKRPTSVTAVSWIVIVLNGLGLIAVPLIFFVVWSHNEDSIARGFRCENGIFPWLLPLCGLFVNVVCGIGLRQGQNIARFMYVTWNGIFFTTAVAMAVLWACPSEALIRIPGLVVFGIVTVFLFDRKANRYFTVASQSHLSVRDYLRLVCVGGTSAIIAIAAVVSPLPERYNPATTGPVAKKMEAAGSNRKESEFREKRSSAVVSSGISVKAECGEGCKPRDQACDVYILTTIEYERLCERVDGPIEKKKSLTPGIHCSVPANAGNVGEWDKLIPTGKTPLVVSPLAPGTYFVGVKAVVDTKVMTWSGDLQRLATEENKVPAYFSHKGQHRFASWGKVRVETSDGKSYILKIGDYALAWYQVSVDANTMAEIVAHFCSEEATEPTERKVSEPDSAMKGGRGVAASQESGAPRINGRPDKPSTLAAISVHHDTRRTEAMKLLDEARSNLTEDKRLSLLHRIIALSQEAVVEDYDTADMLAGLATALVEKVHDPGLRKDVESNQRDVMDKAFRAVLTKNTTTTAGVASDAESATPKIPYPTLLPGKPICDANSKIAIGGFWKKQTPEATVGRYDQLLIRDKASKTAGEWKYAIRPKGKFRLDVYILGGSARWDGTDILLGQQSYEVLDRHFKVVFSYPDSEDIGKQRKESDLFDQ